MKIVEEEDDGAAEDTRRCCGGRFCGRVVGITKRCEFAFPCTARGDALEEGYRTRLAVDYQFKLIALQALDEIAFLVENGDRRLHQFGVDANNIALLLRIRYRAKRDK